MQKPHKLGIVTYNLAKDWDIETIIKNLTECGYEGVELRTTHAHKVEVDLTPDQRREVKKRFEDSPIKIVQLGSAYDYHLRSPEQLRLNIDGAKQYAQLAHDVGAKGIKVRPNGLQEGIPEEVILEQIGDSLAEIAESAAKVGVELRLEVHGKETCRLPRIRKILDYANHPNVFVNWNSNMDDLLDGGFDAAFDLVKDRIRHVHITEIYREEYPWRRLLQRLHEIQFDGYCCAEVPESPEPQRFLKYYKALYNALQG